MNHPGTYAGLLLLILFVVLESCGESKPSESPATMNTQEIDFTTLQKGSLNHPVEGEHNLNTEKIQLHKISDTEEWAAYLDQAMPSQHERDMLPEVDFSAVDVLALHAGQRPSSGYAITIEKINPNDDNLVVSATETIPGKNCMLLAVLTFPFHYAAITKTDYDVSLVISEVAEDC